MRAKRILYGGCVGMVITIMLAKCSMVDTEANRAEINCMNRAHSTLNALEKELGIEYKKQYRYAYVNKVCNR